MTEKPHAPHRIKITVQTDEEGRQVLDCRLTMAIAWIMDPDKDPDIQWMVDAIAVSARKGLLQALDDIKREDIREDLRKAYYEARQFPPVPAGVVS